ncbi:hypothetical protein D3C83_273290 [compost metagenome]
MAGSATERLKALGAGGGERVDGVFVAAQIAIEGRVARRGLLHVRHERGLDAAARNGHAGLIKQRDVAR